MAMNLPTFIPLEEAARRYGLSREVLTRLIEDGKIKAARVNGGITVAENDIREVKKRDRLWKQVEALDGCPIGVKDARLKYSFGAATLKQWIEDGIVRVLSHPDGYGRGKKKLLNEADVAYANLVAKARGRRRGRRIFTSDYLPPHVGAN